MTESRQNVAEPTGRDVHLQVLAEVAEREGRDQLELPPFYEVVDADALEKLVGSLDNGSVSFDYCGYRVEVDSRGSVEVTRAE